jgi:hypothetical protein
VYLWGLAGDHGLPEVLICRSTDVPGSVPYPLTAPFSRLLNNVLKLVDLISIVWSKYAVIFYKNLETLAQCSRVQISMTLNSLME